MKALVLSSGGIDSTTCLGLAIDAYGKENVTALSLTYGQKHSKEVECAEEIAAYYGIRFIHKDITSVMEFSNCSLLEKSTEEVDHRSYAEQIAENEQGRVSTYVPFRNGLLLSIAAAIADSLYPGEEVKIFYGAHADDSAGAAYADCSPEFAYAMSTAITIGTYGNIEVVAPLINMNKAEVVKTGLDINVPYQFTWSCYEGNEEQCGTCGTCIDRKEAFKANNVEDPVGYMEQ